eukprot:3877185-Lingulodinium_polyedra.AAC.1
MPWQRRAPARARPRGRCWRGVRPRGRANRLSGCPCPRAVARHGRRRQARRGGRFPRALASPWG